MYRVGIAFLKHVSSNYSSLPSAFPIRSVQLSYLFASYSTLPGFEKEERPKSVTDIPRDPNIKPRKSVPPERYEWDTQEPDKYLTEPTNYVQLISALHCAPKFDRLEHLVETYHKKFDAVHLAAAIDRVPYVVRKRANETWEFRSTLQERAPLLLSRLHQLLPHHIHRFFPRQIGSCLKNLGRIHEVQYDGMPDMIAMLVSTLPKSYYRFLRVHATPTDLGNIAFGLGYTKHQDEKLMAVLSKCAMASMHAFQAAELAQLAWGYYMAKYADDELFEKIGERVIEVAMDMRAGEVGKIIAAIRFFGIENERVLEALSQALIPQVMDMSPLQLSINLVALGRMKYQNEELLRTLGQRAVLRLDSFDNHNIVNVLEGFARMKFAYPPLLDAFVANVMREPKLDGTPTEIVKVIWSFTKLNYITAEDTPAKQMVMRFIDLLPGKIKYTNAVSLDKLLFSLRMMSAAGALPRERVLRLLDLMAPRLEALVGDLLDYKMSTVLHDYNSLLAGQMNDAAYTFFVAAASKLATSLGPEIEMSLSDAVRCLKHIVARGVVAPDLDNAVAAFALERPAELAKLHPFRVVLLLKQSLPTQAGGEALLLACQSSLASSLTANSASLTNAQLVDAVTLFASAAPAGSEQNVRVVAEVLARAVGKLSNGEITAVANCMANLAEVGNMDALHAALMGEAEARDLKSVTAVLSMPREPKPPT